MFNGLHGGPLSVGVVDMFQGVGAIAGGISAAWLMRRIGDVRLTALGLSLFACASFGFLITTYVGVMTSVVVFGAGVAWVVIAAATAYQRRSPQELQGRVSAATNMLFSLPQTISIATGAALVTLIPYRVEIVIMGAVTLISAGYLATRRVEKISEPEVAVLTGEPALVAATMEA